MSQKRRIDKLEQRIGGDQDRDRVVVCWDEHPAPARPGVKVVTWDDAMGRTEARPDKGRQ